MPALRCVLHGSVVPSGRCAGVPAKTRPSACLLARPGRPPSPALSSPMCGDGGCAADPPRAPKGSHAASTDPPVHGPRRPGTMRSQIAHSRLRGTAKQGVVAPAEIQRAKPQARHPCGRRNRGSTGSLAHRGNQP